MKETLKAGAVYFALVFAAGFVLGTVRTLWVVPRLGVRTAELAEAPIMFGVSILAVRWVGFLLPTSIMGESPSSSLPLDPLRVSIPSRE
jgi:hypothetical protein